MGRPCANLKKPSQFGLCSATRAHEVGIASNRRSACCGEYVPGPCTHRPSRPESGQYVKPVAQPAREGAVERRVRDWDEVVSQLRPSSVTVSEKLGYLLETPSIHPVLVISAR